MTQCVTNYRDVAEIDKDVFITA